MSSSTESSRIITALGFGSCNKQDRYNPFWEIIESVLYNESLPKSNQNPFVMLGDNVYADTPVFLTYRIPATPEQLKKAYETQNNNKRYQRIRSMIPFYFTIDDHDFGKNDGSGRDPSLVGNFSDISQQLFYDFIGEPADSPRRKQHGVYSDHLFEGLDSSGRHRSVHLILLDNRFQRDPYARFYTTTDKQDMLGPEQWEWLANTLSKPAPDLTIIGTGLQVLSHGDPLISESYSLHPESQAKLLSLLHVHGRRRSIFITGDVHFGAFNRLDCATGRHYDFTSSGMTHSWGGPLRRFLVGSALVGHTQLSTPGTKYNGWYSGKNWGLIRFDWKREEIVVNVVGERTDGDGEELSLQYPLLVSTPPKETRFHESMLKLQQRVSFAELDGFLYQQHYPTAGTPRQNVTDQAGRRDITPTATPHEGEKDSSFSNESLRFPLGFDENLIFECANSNLSHGFSHACRAVLNTCTPQLSMGHYAYYVVGHVAIAAVFFGVIFIILFPAYLILRWLWTRKTYGMTGKAASFAFLAIAIALLIRLIETLH